MAVEAVEGWRRAEAWCDNCGWQIQTKDTVEAMAAAEYHYAHCQHSTPCVLGESKTLWKVEVT